jgi:hypothetical protein
MDRAVAERAVFGLRSDREFVKDLIGSVNDVGTVRWGIPMTSEEEAAVDLIGRMAYANEMDAELVPFARSLETFAGAYIDQSQGGMLIIQLTELDAQVEDRLRGMGPNGADFEITLARTPFDQLRTASEAAWRQWKSMSEAKLHSVAIDERGNRLLLGATPLASTQSEALADELSQVLGVDIAIFRTEESLDDACTTRASCFDPMEAGIVIRQGSTTGPRCTMAFHIKDVATGDREYVSAGHCGFLGSNRWYHQAYGFIGTVGPNQLSLHGRDIARYELPDNQVSNNVYKRIADIEGSGNPLQGEAICASLGVSDTFDCGWVDDATFSWESSTCGCPVSGARHEGISTQGGDSGSPIMRQTSSTIFIGVGVHNNANGGFAKLQVSLNHWGWQVYITD